MVDARHRIEEANNPSYKLGIDNEKTDCGHRVGDVNAHGGCSRCLAEGKGAKSDNGKIDWTYVFDFTDAIEEIILILMFGAKKYERGNWQHVEDARRRYTAAIFRHVARWYAGERNDDGPGGSGRHHLAAAGCCMLFLLAMDLRGLFDRKV